MVTFIMLARKVIFSIVAVIGLLSSQMSYASSIKQLDINELLINAELVFEGAVILKKAQWNAQKTDIYTVITFKVMDVVVGNYSEPELSLRFVGGTVDGSTVEIQGSELPKLNERGVYFVESLTQSLVNPLLGWSQGHFVMQPDNNGDMRMMTQNKQAVMGVQAEQLKESYLSEGVVTGVVTEKMKPSSNMENAMSASDFKAQLKAQIETLKQSSKLNKGQ